MTGKEILSVSALVLMLSLFMVLAYQTDYAVNPDKKQYNQGEEIYIFISGPGNAGFTIKIFDPEGDLVFEESGETTGSGNGYLSCPGFSGTGKYDLILFFDGDDVADSSFIVEELEDEEDYCIDCKPATTSTTTSSTTSVISLTTTTATTTVSGSTVYVSTSTSTQGLGTTPTTSLELGTTIPSGNLQLTARRDHFSLIEKPEFDLQFLPKPEPGVEKSLGIKEFTGGESVEALVYDSLNELTNLEPEIEELGGDRFRIRLGGKKSFKPGLYRLKAEFVRDGETYTQELWFKWGLVSVNTKKSLYHPGETAVILMVVLNKEGYPVSNADVTLVVTDPGNNTETFPNELIQEISEGVYQANYLTGGEGNYTLSVTATAADVSTSIESYFMVREYYEFDLLREIPSVIDPQMGPFRSSIYVVSYTNTTSFSLEEYLPKEFELIDDGGASVTVSDDARILSWANLTNNSHVSYLAQAPAIWPYLYEIGPAGIEYNSRVFREARAWYLAVDPTTTNAPSSCDGGWSDCANAYIDDSNYATRTSEGNGVWYGYGFSIPSRAVINTVKVKIKSYVGDDTKHSISLEVYNGSSWGALYNVTPTVTPCTEEVINVTGDFSWTASMVNSIQVRATANIGTGNPSNKWAKICYLPVEVVYNTPPDVKEPETYNTSLVEKKTFEVGDNVTIQVNVTDAEGVSDLDSILITLIDPQGTVRVSNESMTNISAITNGHTYEYNYTSMPAGSTSWGVWSINIHANDTSDSWGSNTTSFNVTEYIVDVTNLEHENNHTYGLDEYESGDTVAWINVTVNNTGNSTVNNVNVSLNVLNSSGVVGWFETQTRGCGTLSVGDGCVVSFSSDTIPNTTNSGLYQWNITLNWSGGGDPPTSNTSFNFTIHNIPDNLSSTLEPSQVNKGYNTTYNFTVYNPWSENLTGVNVTVNCPNIVGLSCTCAATGLPYCDISEIGNKTSYTVSFNITTNTSTPIGDYGINATLNYTNPGLESHSWANQQPQTLKVRVEGVDVIIYNYPENVTRNCLWNLSGYVNNSDVAAQTNVWLNWTLPGGWINETGSLNKFIGNLPFATLNWSNTTVNVSLQAGLGAKTVQLRADSDQSSDWQDITVYVYANTSISGLSSNDSDPARNTHITVKARLLYDNGSSVQGEQISFYDQSEGVLMGSDTTNSTGWATLNYLVPSSASVGTHILNATYPGSTGNYLNPSNTSTSINVHDLPHIQDISATPQTVGYGFNVSIRANVTDLDSMSNVFVNITYPNESSTWQEMINYSADIYEYNFSDTWQWGNYSYLIWANDSVGKINWTGNYTFYVRTNATVGVATALDEYGAKEDVNLTRHPGWFSGWDYRQQVDVTEPGVSNRVNWPVDVYINTDSNADNCTKEFRVTDENNTLIPYTVYNESYSGSKCTGANVVFLVNISQIQTRSYLVYYGNSSATEQSFPIWKDSCTVNEDSTNCSTIFYSRHVLSQGLDSWTFGTQLSLGDDSSSERSLPWTFPYFNRSYSSVHVVSNGYIGLPQNYGSDSSPTQAEFIARDMIAPDWDDLDPSSQGDAYEDSYSNRIVFTWDTVTLDPTGPTPAYPVLFQAVLYETGDMMLRYDEIEGYLESNHLAGIALNNSKDYLNNPHSNMSNTSFYQYSRAGNISIGSEEKFANISRVKETGSLNFSFYLSIRVQTNTTGLWTNVGNPVVDDFTTKTMRTLAVGSELILQPIWQTNGWNTETNEEGTYRVMVQLKDKYDNPLVDDSLNNLQATYNFEIIPANVSLTNLTHENDYVYGVDEYETGDNIAWINVTISSNRSTAVNANITLNILHSGSGVNWGPNETKQCGDIPEYGTCEKRFDNNTNGYNIPKDAAPGVYDYAWNVTMDWENGGSSQNSSLTFTIHHIPDNLSSTLEPSQVNKGYNTTYNFTIYNPWSKNLTGVNVTINCPDAVGLNCTCAATGLPYCNILEIENGTNSTVSFNITTNTSTPIGDYEINATLDYTNPGLESHSWADQQPQTLQVRQLGIDAVIYSYIENVTRNALWDLSGYVNNTDSVTNQTNVWLNWTLPGGWINETGSLNKFIGNLPVATVNWSNITANVSLQAGLGAETIQLRTDSDQSSDWHQVTIYVYANTSISGLSSNDSDPARNSHITVKARLLYDNGSSVQGEQISFYDQSEGMLMGSDTTNSTGWASISYLIPGSASVGSHILNATYIGSTSSYLNPSNTSTSINVHDIPHIKDISATPQTVGYGFNVSIRANVTDLDSVDTVFVNITYPDESSTWQEMSNYSTDIYEYNLSDTWQWGNYTYYIWANDTAGKINQTTSYTFYVRANAWVRVATLNNSYSSDEDVNLTGPEEVWWNTSWQYRQGVNITEPGVNDKVNWPVDVDIATGSHADNCTREFRVVDDDGDSVPYTVHNESYSGGKCVSANVVFLVNISQTETRSYWIYYGNPSATEETFSIWADSCSETLNSSNCSTIHYSRHVLSAGLDSWTTGTTVTDGDDVKAQANLQWNFSYFNQDFSSAWLCTNGFLDFNGSAGTSFTNTENAFKSHVMIAPLWDDLNCYTQGASDEHVYQDDYSNRTVFTWDCSISGDNDNDLQVQIVLYEAGDIMVRYGPITDDSVFSPTAGASNGDNTNYLHNPWGSNEKTAFYQYSRSRNLSKGGEESIWGSQITNLGDTNISGYLLMLVQRNDSGIWTNLSTVVSDASSRIINQSQDLDLSEIWDTYGGWNTNDYTDGEYRVYVAFRNPDNDTLQNDDGSLMLASYVFNITGEPPLIRDVAATPQTVGYGNNVSLKANVTDNGAVSTVFVNITHPDGSSTWQEMVNYSADFYEYNFSDTWQWGNYTYYIWSNDSGGNSNRSGNYTFYVRSNVTIGIQTQLNEYGSNEDINLTNSWSNNTGAVDTNGYLLMLIQRNDSTQWINISTVVANEFHNISSGNALNLSLIWGNNGGWNTDQYAKDTYRVYAELRDPSNNTLLNDTGGYICGWYEFKITPAVIANITRIRIYNVSGSLNPHSDTSDLVDSGLNKTFSLYQDEVYRIEVMVNNTCESKSTWVISDTVIANHTNLNPAWDINYTQDVWYSNETENFTGGNWSNGDVTWNTSLGGSVPINSSVTFHYILNLSNNPTEQRQVIFHIEDSSFTDDDYSAFRIMDKTPPALYNDIYDINATSVSRGESLYLYARWNEGIDSAYAEYNTTSSALQNHTITLPDPNPQNWTNHTIQTNSSWIRGQHVVRILVNDSYGNWDTTLHYLNFTVWALADIDNATLDPDWIYQGSSTTMKCLVRESDTDNPVQGYTVYFYNSTSLLGTNTTNASGWATWTFTDYSLGKENITCNITDWASSFYNKSLSNEGMDELFTAETEAPGYSNVGPSDGTVVHKNDSTPLEANWTDNLELDYAWLATNETGSWENKSGIYNSPQALSGTQDWSNFTWTNLSFTQGQLGWRIYANDTSGNENLTPIMTLGVWGWAEVDASLLNPSVIESGGKTNMSCHVRDANNLVSIANYTVYFYNSTDLMGTNVTNASGWAVFNFTDSSPGTETITCGIENDASLYYNITSDYYLEEDLVTGTPPRLWNDIYNITPNTVFKGTNLSLYARWDENISAAFALYNSTSPTVNEYAMDVPKDNPGNWTNYTIETNGSWLVGGHVAKIRANDTEDNWNNTLPYLNFTVWGWSKAEWNSPTGSVDRGMITLRCNVTDNLSKEGVYNYPVYFYNHSGIPVGSSNTNASGVASLNLDTSGYPVGSQSFSCVTYDAPTLYYNRSGDYQASQSITLMGTLNVSTDNPVNGTIVYMGENISLNSSTRDENNLDVTPDTANWYNSTDKNIGSGEDISWVIGASYELGPELIKVNVSKTSYKPDEDNVTLLVYGWSNVSWISPNETSAYVQGTMVDLTCRVRDVNNSGDLEGYTVYFYYNTTADAYLGINSSNSSGHAVFTWNTSSAGVGTYYPKCNITEDPSVYYNASEVNEANTTVNITSLGYLEVNLTMPPTGVLNHVGQNKTFVMNASVTCRGADCGNVDGTARYNTTSSQHDTEMPVGSGSPFHIVGAQNTQDCLNNPLSQNESCTLNWTVNATGAVYSTWNVGVKFTSQSAGTASTDSAEISIDMVLVMTVSNYTLDFGVGIDSVDPSENCSSAKNDPITITMDENSNNADAIWIKGTDLTAGANAIGVGNITWSKGTSCATAKGDGNFLSYDYKKVHETLVAGDSIDTYYWIDIPPTPFAVYTGSMYIMANASY